MVLQLPLLTPTTMMMMMKSNLHVRGNQLKVTGSCGRVSDAGGPIMNSYVSFPAELWLAVPHSLALKRQTVFGYGLSFNRGFI
jgi:hypothetical protein